MKHLSIYCGVMPTTDHAAGRTHRHAAEPSPLLETLLDLDALIHGHLIDDALDAVATHMGSGIVRQVLDVGAGTGAATFRLSHRFAQAQVTALDSSASRAQRIADRAVREGAAGVRALPRSLSETGLAPHSVDLAWASSVFHEFRDPIAAFAVLSALIRPGGVLAIMEMDSPPRVLPQQYHALEQRLRGRAHADAPQPEWSTSIRAAGFALLEKRTLSSDQNLAVDGPGGDYARAELQRLAARAGLPSTADDRVRLSRVLDSSTGVGTPRVHIRGARSLWLARRP